MTFVRYVGIQLIAYFIDMGGFLVILRSGLISVLMANIIGKLAAGSFAFAAHRSFTFKVIDNADTTRQALRYFTLLALNIPLASAVLSLFLIWIKAPVFAKLGSDVVCVVISFGLSKYFVFTKRRS